MFGSPVPPLLCDRGRDELVKCRVQPLLCHGEEREACWLRYCPCSVIREGGEVFRADV